MSALVSGTLFGAGLALSGMMNPAKVLGFLDLFGQWDPSLALVMGGALLVTVPAFRIAARRKTSLLGAELALPTRRTLDRKLIGGAALFGIGWGLVGLCPGPAIAALVTGRSEALMFAASMVAGMLLHRGLLRSD